METGMSCFCPTSSHVQCATTIVDPGQEWVFYDVEGCRGQRGESFVAHAIFRNMFTRAAAAWAPFFDDGECYDSRLVVAVLTEF